MTVIEPEGPLSPSVEECRLARQLVQFEFASLRAKAQLWSPRACPPREEES